MGTVRDRVAHARRSAQAGILRLACGCTVLALAGCASGRIACPERGGPRWLELRSKHFVVRTDLPERQAREATFKLEDLRAALLQAVWDRTDLPGAPAEVVLFRDLLELHDFLPLELDGTALSGDDGGHLLIGQAGQQVERRTTRIGSALTFVTRQVHWESALAFEVALALGDSILHRQPAWLAQGLATFLESVHWDEGGRATIGEPSEWLALRALDPDLHLNPGSLVAGERRLVIEDPANRVAFVSDSWALVHWLFNRRGGEFSRYLDRLRKGQDPQAAWYAEVGLVGTALDDEVRGYFDLARRGEPLRTLSVEAWIAQGELRAGPLADAEVHALWARLLRGFRPEEQQRIALEVAEAARSDPQGVAALLAALPDLSPEERFARARQAAAGHPDDWRAHYVLGLASSDPEEKAGALEAAAARAPQQPGPLSALARVRAGQRRCADALGLAKRALVVGGVSTNALGALAVAYAAAGRCDAAAETLLQTRELFLREPTAASRQRMADLEQQVEELHCTAPR